jgi:hypothetical protein
MAGVATLMGKVEALECEISASARKKKGRSPNLNPLMS